MELSGGNHSLEIVKYILEKAPLEDNDRVITSERINKLDTLKFLIEEQEFRLDDTRNLLQCTKNIDVAKYLVEEMNLDPLAKCLGGGTLLYGCQDLELVKFYISKGVNSGTPCEDNNELPFHQCNSRELVEYYVSIGINPRVRTKDKMTLFHRTWSTEILDYLLDLGVEINEKVTRKYFMGKILCKANITALHNVVMTKNIDATELLLSSGATPCNLHRVTNVNIVKALIKAGSNVNALNRIGATALQYAVKSNDLEIVKLLIKAGANINVSCKEGFTPLHMVCYTNNTKMALLLLENDAKVDIVDKAGNQALHYSRNAEVALAILKKLDRRVEKL